MGESSTNTKHDKLLQKPKLTIPVAQKKSNKKWKY